MKISDLLQSSFDSLERTKGRSALTMLGIVIGIMSVILMLSIGEAAQRYILAQVSAFGSDVLYVQNGPSVDEGQPTLFQKTSLTLKDVKKLQTQAWIPRITAKVSQSDVVSANGFDANAQIVGTMPDELFMSDIHVESGNFLSTASVDGHTREAVIGKEIADKAFGAEEPLGKTVKISGTSFRVIGVMQRAGTKSFQNIDKQVYIPVTSAMDLYNKEYLSTIALRSAIPVNEAKQRLTVLLRERHNIENEEEDPSKDDFHIQTQEDLLKSAGEITSILQILLISIAAISLLVGGIGIMNIMYVTVTERTKEIGLRKSIGAKKSDVLSQFLVESVVLTVLGGIVGTSLGIGFSWLGIKIISSFQAGWSFDISWRGVALGLGVSAAIGIVFGYFPARRAAKLHPIEALRFE